MSRSYSLLLELLCVLACAQLALSFDCSFTGALGDYDLTQLTGTQISGVGTQLPPNWSFFLNMCGTASGTSDYPCTSLSPAAMVCQVYQPTPSGNTYAIAYNSDQTGAHKFTEITSPWNGVQLAASGQVYGGCTKNVYIQIKCDATITAVPTTLSSNVAEDQANCRYTLQLAHASGCPGYKNPNSGGGSSGLSGGTIFLIVVLVCSFVYVAGGCFYKRYQKGTTGMIESCPNNEFWTAIPGLVKDGCLYTVRKLKSLCGGGGSTSGGTGSYENI